MWEADLRQGQELLAGGKFGEAETRLAEALAKLDHDSAGPEVLGPIWLAMSQARRGQRRWPQAVDALTRALHPLRKIYGPEDPRLAVLLFQLGQLLGFSGKPADGELALNESLALTRKLATPIELATFLGTLADFCLFHGAPQRALGHLQEAVALQVAALGQEHPAVLTSQLAMVVIFEMLGRFDQADDLCQKIQKSSAPEAQLLRFEAGFRRAMGKKKQRLWVACGEQLVRTVQDSGGDEKLLARCYGEMGNTYLALGQLAEAEKILVQAYQSWMKILGAEHPQVAIAAADLARVWQCQNRIPEAEQGYTFAHSVFHRQLGETHPLTLSLCDRMIECFVQRKDYARAQHLTMENMKLRSAVYGDEHPLVGESLSLLGRIWLEQRQYIQAGDVLAQALRIFSLHPDTGDFPPLLARYSLGASLQGAFKYYEAEEHYRQVMQAVEQYYGDSHYLLPHILRNLGWLLRQTGRDRQAAECMKRAESLALPRK